MTVLTEKTIRKIISSKIKKKDSLCEIGFDVYNQGRGRFDAATCDLSNLKNSKKFPLWFAKNFLYNPEITSLENGVPKKTVIGFLNYDLTPEEEEEYEKKVRQELERNPNVTNGWISSLEFLLTVSIGPFSKLACRIVNRMFDDQGTKTSRENNADVEERKIFFKNAVDAAADKFVVQNSIVLDASLTKETAFFFYKTNKMLSLGKNEEAREEFAKEDERIKKIIDSVNTLPSKLYKEIEDHFYGINRKRIILSSIKSFCLDDINKESYVSGDAIRSYLNDIRENARNYFRGIL
jgi:hypothetical protein